MYIKIIFSLSAFLWARKVTDLARGVSPSLSDIIYNWVIIVQLQCRCEGSLNSSNLGSKWDKFVITSIWPDIPLEGRGGRDGTQPLLARCCPNWLISRYRPEISRSSQTQKVILISDLSHNNWVIIISTIQLKGFNEKYFDERILSIK